MRFSARHTRSYIRIGNESSRLSMFAVYLQEIHSQISSFCRTSDLSLKAYREYERASMTVLRETVSLQIVPKCRVSHDVRISAEAAGLTSTHTPAIYGSTFVLGGCLIA